MRASQAFNAGSIPVTCSKIFPYIYTDGKRTRKSGFDYQRKAGGRTPVCVSICAPVRPNEVKVIPVTCSKIFPYIYTDGKRTRKSGIVSFTHKLTKHVLSVVDVLEKQNLFLFPCPFLYLY